MLNHVEVDVINWRTLHQILYDISPVYTLESIKFVQQEGSYYEKESCYSNNA